MDIIDRISGRSSARKDHSAEDKASWWSYTFLFYLNPLFTKGNLTTIELVDLGPVSQQDRTDLLYKRFAEHWVAEAALPLEQQSLWRALFKTVGIWKLAISLVLYTGYSAIGFGPVLILNVLVKYFQGTQDLSKGKLQPLMPMPCSPDPSSSL